MNQPAIESGGPDRPPPVLPEAALFLSEYAALELTITAGRDGSMRKVVISKPSQARLYDEYTRNWVEKHWKMPDANPGEPELRKFVAPIVYPKKPKPLDGYFPKPPYPDFYLRNHVEGLVMVEFTVAPSGKVATTRTILSSGRKGLDAFTEDWVRRNWKFPPGEERRYYWRVAYLIE